jgi:hypothetical protein
MVVEVPMTGSGAARICCGEFALHEVELLPVFDQ